MSAEVARKSRRVTDIAGTPGGWGTLLRSVANQCSGRGVARLATRPPAQRDCGSSRSAARAENRSVAAWSLLAGDGLERLLRRLGQLALLVLVLDDVAECRHGIFRARPHVCQPAGRPDLRGLLLV